MKPTNTGPVPTPDVPKHPSPLGSQQAVAEKANAKAAPIVPGGTAQPNEDPFKSYSLNAVIDAAGK